MRRRTPLRSSRGTVIPTDTRRRVLRRDGRCVGARLGWPSHVNGVAPLELDHVRASHGMGMKSETTEDNLVALCYRCHDWKTEHGREARPVLLAYLATFYEVTA